MMPNRLGVPGPSKLQIGRQHLKDMRSNAMSSSCVQIGYDGIQIECSRDVQDFFVANPLSLISKVFRNIPFRTEARVMMHQKCVANTSFVMPNSSPLKIGRNPKGKSSSNHPFLSPYARTKQRQVMTPSNQNPPCPPLPRIQSFPGSSLAMPRAKGVAVSMEGCMNLANPGSIVFKKKHEPLFS